MTGKNKKKYKFTKETKKIGKVTLHRIIALRKFGFVSKGQKGGFIESHDNLSHDGNCWVYDDSLVYGKARVSGNAYIDGKSRVYQNAVAQEESSVIDATLCGNGRLRDSTRVSAGGLVTADLSSAFYGYLIVKIKVTKLPILVTRNDLYTVIIGDKEIQIGCMVFTPDKLRKATEESFVHINGRNALEMLKVHREWLLKLAAIHQNA